MKTMDACVTKGSSQGRRFKKGLLFLLIAGLGLILLYLWLSRTLPRYAISELGRLTHTQIRTQTLTVDPKGQVQIHGLTIYPNQPLPQTAPLLKAEEVTVKFSWMSLLRRRPRISHIDLQDYHCQIVFDPNSHLWNIEGLTFTRSGSGAAGQWPQVVLENGIVDYLRLSKNQHHRLLRVPLDVTIKPDPLNDQGLAFEIKTGPITEGFGISRLEGKWRPGLFTIAGGISTIDPPDKPRTWSIPIIATELQYDPQGNYHLLLTAKDVEAQHKDGVLAMDWLSSLLIDTCKPLTKIAHFIDRYRPAGRADIQKLSLQGNFKAIEKSRISGTFHLIDAYFHDRKFPYPIDQLQGQVYLTEHSIMSSGLQGRHKDAEITIDFGITDFGPNWKYDVHMASDHLPLDKDLYQALSPGHQALWKRLDPVGHIAIDFRNTKRSPTDKKRILKIHPLQTDICYRDFPYPLKQLTGEIQFHRDGKTVLNLANHSSRGSVFLKGDIRVKGNEPSDVNLVITGHGIPFDETLAQALPPRQRETYRQLKLHGTAQAEVLLTKIPNQGGLLGHTVTRVRTQDASMTVPGWHTALQQVNMDVLLAQKDITIHNLHAVSGSSAFQTQGTVHTADSPENTSYSLKIEADAFTVQDLIAGLPDETQETIKRLHASGPLQIKGHIKQNAETAFPQYQFTVQCQNNQAKPDFFSYPLTKIRGTLDINNKRILFNPITAHPDVNEALTQSALSIKGRLVNADGQLENLHLEAEAQAFPFTPVFVKALPPSAQSVLEPLCPSGYITLSPSRLTYENGTSQPKYQTQVLAQFIDNQFTLLNSPADMQSQIQADIAYEESTGITSGQIDIHADHLSWREKKAMDVDIHLLYDQEQQKWKTERFIGDLYGGHILGDLQMNWLTKSPPWFRLRLGITGVDLEGLLRAASQATPSHTNLSKGLLSGDLSLGFTPADSRICVGQMNAYVHDMQLGAHSPLSQFLNAYRPDVKGDIQFDRLYLKAYIQDKQINIDNLDLSGKQLALKGTGSLDLAKNDLDLTLLTRGKRSPTSAPRLLESLSEGLGSAMMRLKVTGDPTDPNVTTIPLPVIEDSLRLLGSPD